MIRLQLKVRRNERTSKYSSYAGPVGKLFPDLLGRNFKADYFGHKIVTDVTEYKVNGRRLYLSIFVDLYTHMIVSYSLSCSPSVEFTAEGLKQVLAMLPKDKLCIIHSDQGQQYQRQSYREIIAEYQNVKQSMSCKGNCLDNAHAECAFAQIKREGPDPIDPRIRF